MFDEVQSLPDLLHVSSGKHGVTIARQTFRYSCMQVTSRKKAATIFAAYLISTATLSAQKNAAVKQDSSKKATVQVIVTDTRKQPRKGEQVLLQAQHTGKEYAGRSDVSGRFTILLPPGDNYTIRVKALTDTTMYGTLEVPALQPGQFFTAPFVVDIEYEPARSYTLDNVHFDFGKATLRPESYKELNELAEYLKWRDNEKAEIAGHTDNVGRDADNLKLSQQRAETVRNYIIKKGIKADRISAKGYGATQPVAENDTDEGRQKNRRTEVRFL